MKNIKITIIILALTTMATGESVAQKYQWTKMVTADNHAVDPKQKLFEGNDGDFYVAMRFFSTIRIGTPPKKKKEKIPSLSAGSKYAFFFGKFNAQGNPVWNKMFKTGAGGTQWSTLMTAISDAVVDSQGNIYMTGKYEKSIDFGNDVTLKSKGLNDMFVVKLDSDGNAVWAKTAGGISTKNLEPGGHKVALDADENLIVLGQVSGWGDKTKATDKSGTAFFDGENLNVSIVGASILVKIAPDGTTQWIKQSTGMPTLDQLDMDDAGNIYMAGKVMYLGGWEDVSIDSNGLNDMVMVKLDKNGALVWYKQFGYGNKPMKAGDTDTDGILGLAVTPAGEITIAGNIKSGGKINGKKITGKGFNDMVQFIAGFSTDGDITTVNTFAPDKTGILIMGSYKSDSEGRLLTFASSLKPFGYGNTKIKDNGVYRFANSGDMEQVVKITGSELQGYIIIPWDYLTINESDVMTIGTLTTPANIGASGAMVKYWEKTYKIPKGNPETGVVYSFYSK